MKKIVCLFLLFLLSCGLNSKQEKQLLLQTNAYLEAEAQNKFSLIVTKTYQDFVKCIKEQGEEKFNAVFFTKNFEQLEIKAIKKVKTVINENDIHVLFEIKAENLVQGSFSPFQFKIVAISEDGGENWYFLKYAAYGNKKNCLKIKRLLN